MRKIVAITFILLLGCQPTPPKPSVVLKPDTNRPVVINGCEKALKEGRHVDC